jgi:hypothetical protein
MKTNIIFILPCTLYGCRFFLCIHGLKTFRRDTVSIFPPTGKGEKEQEKQDEKQAENYKSLPIHFLDRRNRLDRQDERYRSGFGSLRGSGYNENDTHNKDNSRQNKGNYRRPPYHGG